MYQAPLPEAYQNLDPEEIRTRIRKAKAALGNRVVILGHHYQRDEVVEHADYLGDSFKLCKDAQKHLEAEFIVFCGVHFMAESANILTDKKVILPNLAAGCSMADMANIFQVRKAWKEIENVLGIDDLRSTIDELEVSRRANSSVLPVSNPKSKIQNPKSHGSSIVNRKSSILPITYINSAANLKAFVGMHGGTIWITSEVGKGSVFHFEIPD